MLHATRMFENKDGFHLDLFIGRVVGKLALSESMISRAELFKAYSNLFVYLVSREDIFLFKGLASEGRKRDLPDLQVLYPNLNWKIIEDELNSQSLGDDLRALFIRRLEAFSQAYQLEVPILSRLKKQGRN